MDGDWEAQSWCAEPIAVFLLGFHPAWKWRGAWVGAGCLGSSSQTHTSPRRSGAPCRSFLAAAGPRFSCFSSPVDAFVVTYVHVWETSPTKTLDKTGLDAKVIVYSLIPVNSSQLMWSCDTAQCSLPRLGGALDPPLTFMRYPAFWKLNYKLYCTIQLHVQGIFNSNLINNNVHFLKNTLLKCDPSDALWRYSRAWYQKVLFIPMMTITSVRLFTENLIDACLS